MTFKDRLKKLAKAVSVDGDSGSSDKPKPAPNPKATLKEHPLASRQDIRDRSKPFHELLDKFTIGGQERRKSSAGNISPMGSRRGSFISFRRMSRDTSNSDEKADRRASVQKAHGKPHSGDPHALTPILSVQEPRDDTDIEPKAVRGPAHTKADPSVTPILEKHEPESHSGMTPAPGVGDGGDISPGSDELRVDNTAEVLAGAGRKLKVEENRTDEGVSLPSAGEKEHAGVTGGIADSTTRHQAPAAIGGTAVTA